jgi:hypothetical protein
MKGKISCDMAATMGFADAPSVVPSSLVGVDATAAGLVGHTEIWRVSDHPVCDAKVGFAEIFLMPQPPLLTRRGLAHSTRSTV